MCCISHKEFVLLSCIISSFINHSHLYIVTLPEPVTNGIFKKNTSKYILAFKAVDYMLLSFRFYTFEFCYFTAQPYGWWLAGPPQQSEYYFNLKILKSIQQLITRVVRFRIREIRYRRTYTGLCDYYVIASVYQEVCEIEECICAALDEVIYFFFCIDKLTFEISQEWITNNIYSIILESYWEMKVS